MRPCIEDSVSVPLTEAMLYQCRQFAEEVFDSNAEQSKTSAGSWQRSRQSNTSVDKSTRCACGPPRDDALPASIKHSARRHNACVPRSGIRLPMLFRDAIPALLSRVHREQGTGGNKELGREVLHKYKYIVFQPHRDGVPGTTVRCSLFPCSHQHGVGRQWKAKRNKSDT